MSRSFGILALALCGTAAFGQTALRLPEASPRAAVEQRVALTDVTIVYHRPLVGGRKIWGGIVPYDKVWRAGANENTTIQFSDDVAVEGQPLAKGTYGLHMIPGAESWTVIFSKTANAWGSFTYDKTEDALRVTVKPEVTEPHEALTYAFDDLKPDSARVTLAWEKVLVPFRISVDNPTTTVSRIREQFRGGVQYYWEALDQAAHYCLANKLNLDEALVWAGKSIEAEERMENQMTRSQLLDALHRPDEAKAAKARALEIATVTQLYYYGRTLQVQKQPEEGLRVMQTVTQRFPEHWLGHMAQARLASSKGEYDKALEQIKLVQGMVVPEQQKANLVNLAKRLENREDINR